MTSFAAARKTTSRTAWSKGSAAWWTARSACTSIASWRGEAGKSLLWRCVLFLLRVGGWLRRFLSHQRRAPQIHLVNLLRQFHFNDFFGLDTAHVEIV